ncbi:MAG: PEP-CTERM sorting domain-containing protein [Bryobacteraceae bacterium]
MIPEPVSVFGIGIVLAFLMFRSPLAGQS